MPTDAPRLRLIAVVAAAILLAGLAAFVITGERSAGATGDQAAPGAASSQVAIVDGQVITAADLDAALGLELARLEEDLYGLRKRGLDQLIGERLLALEAARRGLDVAQLVAAEITDRAGTVTDEEVQTFVTANKARLPGSADLEGQVRQYLAKQRMQERRESYIAALRAKATVDVSLATPPARRAAIDIDGAPVRGEASAPVTIVEFSDFHCPFCRRVQPTLMQLLARYSGKVRLVYKDLPLDGLHPQARRASEAAACAGDQGRFWEYHDRIYAGGSDVSPAHLAKLAAEAGLEPAAFDECLRSGRHVARIQADVEQGSNLGINGTPAFFINGRPLSGAQPIDAFVALIEDELKLAAAR